MSLTLTSPSNPKLKQIRALRQRKERAASGLVVVEGIHHVGEAVAAGAQIEYLCYAPDLLESEFARDLIEQQSALGVPCYATTPQIFESLAEKDNPQGLLAVVHQRLLTLDTLTPDTFPWGVALVAPQDPGNVGAILRTIDAVGASGLVLLDNGVDVYHPSAVRASMGTVFHLPVVAASFAAFTEWVKQHRYHLYGTSVRGSSDYQAVAYARPAILLLGSEQKGLSAEHLAACDTLIRLPMRGRVSSLNLAVAAGVMLYAMAKVTSDK